MKRDEAIDTARNAAVRFGKLFVVWRMPGWAADEYGVIAEDRGLPDNATVVYRCEPAAAGVDKAQGNLF